MHPGSLSWNNGTLFLLWHASICRLKGLIPIDCVILIYWFFQLFQFEIHFKSSASITIKALLQSSFYTIPDKIQNSPDIHKTYLRRSGAVHRQDNFRSVEYCRSTNKDPIVESKILFNLFYVKGLIVLAVMCLLWKCFNNDNNNNDNRNYVPSSIL